MEPTTKKAPARLGNGLTRRDLRTTALGAAWMAAPSRAARAESGGRASRETVAIFGGGVGGLTVAHELAERGFAVTVFEKGAWGGKVRSYAPASPRPGGSEARVTRTFFSRASYPRSFLAGPSSAADPATARRAKRP